MPAMTRQAISHATEPASPAPIAPIASDNAATCMVRTRPKRSASRPAYHAPSAEPSRAMDTANPVSAALSPKAWRRESTAPLITAVSNPNRKPPRAAAAAISATRSLACRSVSVRIGEGVFIWACPRGARGMELPGVVCRWSVRRRRLFGGRCLAAALGVDQMAHLQVHAIGPAEADHVGLVTRGDLHVRVAEHHVVLLADGAVLRKAAVDGAGELARDALGVVAEAVVFESLHRDPVGRRPAEWRIPLRAGVARAHREAALVLEQLELLDQITRLLLRSNAGPQRIEHRQVRIGRSLAGDEIVIHVAALVGVPQVFVDRIAACLGGFRPALGIGGLAEFLCERFEIAFVAIQQAVQARARVVVGGTAERSEMEIGVEAGFAHRAVAEVVVGGEAIAVQPVARADFRFRNITTGGLQGFGLRRVRMLRRLEEIARILRRMCPQPADHADVVVTVLRLDDRPVSVIEVARQPGVTGEMLFADRKSTR